MGSRVILADDSVTIQKVVGIIFANEGYDLTVVSSGDAAITKAREIRPDVMLVDALMPGKNGYEVCREIRQDPALAHTAILLMSGAFEAVDEEKNRQSGADDFITKPFESQALIDATNRLIALTAGRIAKPAAVSAPPAAPEPPQAVASPSLPPAAAAVDDIWATGFDDEPAAVPAAPVQPAAASPAPSPAAPAVKAADDLWGAFDMDEIEASPAPGFAVAAPVPATAADDIFSFEMEAPTGAPVAAEEEYVLDEIAFDEPRSVGTPPVSGFEPVGEQEIFFDDKALVQEAQPGVALPADDEFGAITFDEPEAPVAAPAAAFAEDDFGSIAFDEPQAAVASPAAAAPPIMPVIPPTPVEPPAPAFEAVPQPPPAAAPPAPQPVAAAGPLDEAQLKAMLATVSRDVIERIVWEVVPDLAETIIKEEIRKLKAGIA